MYVRGGITFFPRSVAVDVRVVRCVRGLTCKAFDLLYDAHNTMSVCHENYHRGIRCFSNCLSDLRLHHQSHPQTLRAIDWSLVIWTSALGSSHC